MREQLLQRNGIMSDFETVISGIQNKVRRLQEERNNLRTVLEQQEQRCQELQKALDNQHITITNLKQQNQITNQGKTLALKGDPTEIRHKIAQMIQAIDETIAQLSDIQ